LLDTPVEREVVRVLIKPKRHHGRQDTLPQLLEKHRHRAEVYLQYDAMRLETHSITAAPSASHEGMYRSPESGGVFTTLTMVAALDVNDDEIGDCDHGSDGDATFVGGVASSRNSVGPQWQDRSAASYQPGVLKRMEPQTKASSRGAIHCAAMLASALLQRGLHDQDGRGEWKSLTKLVGHTNRKQHLELVANRSRSRTSTRNCARWCATHSWPCSASRAASRTRTSPPLFQVCV